MGQRKLTDDQMNRVVQAKCCIYLMCDWHKADGGNRYWCDVYQKLLKMIHHGTTDGKPYVEPQPEIGEGYRVATEADKGRFDLSVWCSGFQKWVDGYLGTYHQSLVFRVPVDRIPTDLDARERPTVMVRDCKSSPWQKATLLSVCPNQTLAFSASMTCSRCSWRYCRFPYPGE